MRNSPTAAGRILTLFSIVFLVVLSFTVISSESKHTNTHFLYKRDVKSSAAAVQTTQDLPTPTPSQVSSSSNPPSASSSKPSATSTPVSQKPTSTLNTSTALTSSDVPSSTPTTTATATATDTTSSSQASSDAITVSSSAVTSSSSLQSSVAPSVTYGTSQSPTVTPKVTNQATVMRTGTAAQLPTSTASVSAAPITSSASSSGFWANKGAVAGTFTVISLIGIVLLFMGYNIIARRRRHARYRREDEEAYYEKSAQQPGGLGDSGLEETEASMTNVMTPASTDAYPDRQIHFGASAPHGPQVVYAPQDYGIDYPPDTNYHQATAQGEYQHADDGTPSAQFTPEQSMTDPNSGYSAHDASGWARRDPFHTAGSHV